MLYCYTSFRKPCELECGQEKNEKQTGEKIIQRKPVKNAAGTPGKLFTALNGGRS